MTRRCVLFLLISGWCHVQTNDIIRHFHAIDQKKSWAKAQSYCRDTFNDLATIQHQTNNADAQQVAESGKFWIGLYRSTWKWSQDDKDAQLDTSFTNWASNEPGDGKCVTISALGFWSVSNCGAQRFFTCYSGEHHILEQQSMTWSDARTFCRSVHTDLSSIRTQQENQDVSRLLQNVTGGGAKEAESSEEGGGVVSVSMAWIGLYRHFWKWSDQSGAPYRQWALQQPDESKDCVVMDVKSSSADWFSRSCSEKHEFLCHSDIIRALVLRSVKVRLSAGSADLNDPTIQDAVLQQLKKKLKERGINEEVKLRWRDNAFHREEDRAPPGDCEEKHFSV